MMAHRIDTLQLFSISERYEPRDSYLANSGTGVRIQLP